MASGDLFRGFLLRFSMKKDQHVRMLEKFEDNRLNGGKAKTQIIMDALEMYYHALESDGGSGEDETVTVREMDVQRCSMDFDTHFEIGAGGVGDCPAFGRECVEDDAVGLSRRTVLGERL